MENENEGLWGHIVSLAPRVEIEELRSIIGAQLIEKSVTLWDELKAFSSILTDIQTLEFDLPASAISDKKGLGNVSNNGTMRKVANEDSVKASGSDLQQVPYLDLSKADKVSLDSRKIVDTEGNPMNHNNNNNNNNDEEYNQGKITDRSNMSMDSFDFIRSIEDSICVSRIHEVVEQIRSAFQQEQEELESEINILYNAMDTESDLIASSSSSSSTKGHSNRIDDDFPLSNGSKMSTTNSGSPKMFQTKDASSGSTKFVKMQRFVSPEHNPGRIRPRKNKDKQEQEEMNMKMEMDAKAEGEEKEKKSKVWNKLQAARDEKHFLDI